MFSAPHPHLLRLIIMLFMPAVLLSFRTEFKGGKLPKEGPVAQKNSRGHTLSAPLPVRKKANSDPIRFDIKCPVRKASVGEEIELTITARLMNISPNLMFFLPGSNAYTLKMLLPTGFQQTGGSLTEFVRDELAYPSKAEATYTIRGFFTNPDEKACFRLIRGDGQASSQSLFVEKATLCLPVHTTDKPGAARTATTTTAFNWCAEAESGSGNRSAGSNGQASGGQAVGGFGNSSEYMNYTIAGVPAGGAYTLHLWYSSGETPQFGIVVNGNLQTASGSSNSSWTGPFVEKMVAINLQAGTNSLRIQGAGGSFVLDRLCVDGGGGSGCTPPSLNLGTPACSNNSFYAVSFTTQAGASVSSSAGSVQGNQVVNIPAGTNVTVTASLNGCSAQQTANSPSCNSGGNPPGGNTNTVTKVRFYFRSDNCAPCRNRCAQSQIQGSTDNQNWTTLAIIPSVADGWNEVSLTNPTAWRYVRYQSSGGCYGELMELEFYNGGTKLSGTPFGSAGLDATTNYTSAFDGNLATLWHGNQPGTQNFAGLDLGTFSGGTGSLVSGNCYLIKSQQTSSANNTLQAIGNQVLLRSANGQADQIWKAESVGSQYRFTSQAGNRDQVLYVDGLSDGQPLKLGSYVANERYQWSLASSSQGGYRVYGGNNQNTWDQQGAGTNDVLQLYGSNANATDYHWNQPYRRFSFSSVGCPTTACTPPSLSLGAPACTGPSTYSVGFSTQAGATVTSSAGIVQGNQVTYIPTSTNVTVTASLGGCSAQQTANSPSCITGGDPVVCGTGNGLTGFYTNTTDLSDYLVVIRNDAQINFTWNNASPEPGTVVADGFSVRWFGQVEAPVSGNYTFKTNNDDGTRLWVNGQLLIDDWNGHAPEWRQGSIYLSAGQKYDIEMDYVEYWGGAQAQLYWEYPGQTTQIVPSCRLYPKQNLPQSNSIHFNNSLNGCAEENPVTVTLGCVEISYCPFAGIILTFNASSCGTGGPAGGTPSPPGPVGPTSPTSPGGGFPGVPGGPAKPFSPPRPLFNLFPISNLSAEELSRRKFYTAMQFKGIYFTGDEVALLNEDSKIRGSVWAYVNDYGHKPSSLEYLSLNLNTATDNQVQVAIEVLMDPGVPKGITPAELRLMGINTSAFRGNLNKYYNDAKKASQRTIYHYGYHESMETGTSIANAFKHAFFQIMHVKSFGRQLGAQLAKEHEDRPQDMDCKMDLWNNEEGLKIYDAVPNSTDQQFDDAVYFNVINGEMRYMKEGWGSDHLTKTNQ